MHPAQLSIEEFVKQCEFRTQRRSGPGGQHRNKVETAVFATHTPTGIMASSTKERSQAANRSLAIERLRIKVAIEYRTPNLDKSEVDFELSELWASRNKGKRILISRRHGEYPALLAEALDCICRFRYDDAAAAEALGLSRTQLLKFVSMEPLALASFNSERERRGLPRFLPK